ncbi:MAG: hypothetical protein PF508_22040 [Spirochaeta sp.]|jgi:hypothetical protein|nr:hypothetical protein [Spirochaeta sp.]
MKRTILLLFVATVFGGFLAAQDAPAAEDSGPFDSPEAFRRAIDVGTSLYELNMATDDMAQLEAIAGRVLILDGTAANITVYSEEPEDFYIELELVSGRWDGVESVQMFRVYVVLDDPAFAGLLAERAPRDPDPELILRSDRVLVAGRLVSLAEDPEGRPVPVLHAYDIRALR